MFYTFVLYKAKSKNFTAPLRGDSALDVVKCVRRGCKTVWKQITLIEEDRQYIRKVEFCHCIPHGVRLLGMGFMPITPNKPRTAIALPFLQKLNTMWNFSPMGIDNYVAGIWANTKERHGVLTGRKTYEDRNGGPIVRKAFGYYREMVMKEIALIRSILEPSERAKLAACCPACWGPRNKSDLLLNELDVLLAGDGNFSQWRAAAASRHDTAKPRPPCFLESKFINEAYKQEGVYGHKLKVTQKETECSDDWKAKDGGEKRGGNKKADSGLFALVCRHDMAPKMVNLEQGGERMRYPLSLLMWLREADPEAYVGFLYDIGCNFQAHLEYRKLFVEDRAAGRLKIAVAVFHAYAHNYMCQSRFNPQLIDGFGLTDGEGVERFWSKLAALVRLNRNASSSTRQVNIHFRTEHINDVQKYNLASWILRRLDTTQTRLADAEKGLEEALAKGWTETRLQEQLDARRVAQTKEGEKRAAEDRAFKYRQLALVADEANEFEAAMSVDEEMVSWPPLASGGLLGVHI